MERFDQVCKPWLENSEQLAHTRLDKVTVLTTNQTAQVEKPAVRVKPSLASNGNPSLPSILVEKDPISGLDGVGQRGLQVQTDRRENNNSWSSS